MLLCIDRVVSDDDKWRWTKKELAVWHCKVRAVIDLFYLFILYFFSHNDLVAIV